MNPQALLDRAIDQAEATLRERTADFLAARITLDQWRTDSEDAIRLAHAAAAQSAAVQFHADANDFLDATNRVVDEQLVFFDQFTNDLRSGSQPLNGTALTRAALYARAARGTFQNLSRENARTSGMTHERRVTSDAEHCQECLDLAAQGWQPLDTLPPIGAATCTANCRCHFEFSDHVPFARAETLWKEPLHPRGAGGRFTLKSSQTAAGYSALKGLAAFYHFAQQNNLSTIDDLYAHCTNKLGLESVELGDNVEIAADTVATLHTLKMRGFPLPPRLVISRDFFDSHGAPESSAGFHVDFDKNGEPKPETATLAIHPDLDRRIDHMRLMKGVNWSSTDDPLHPVLHEFGHWLHFHSQGALAYLFNRPVSLISRAQLALLDWGSYDKLGRYAMTTTQEFVAETFAGTMLGKRYSPAVMAAFERFGGHL